MKLMRFLLPVLFAGAALAQDEPKPLRQVSVRLLAFDATSIPQESFALDPAALKTALGTAAPVKGYLNHEAIELKLFGNEILFSKSANPADLETAGNEFAKVKLPKTGDRFIFIFLPAGNGKFRILPVDDSIKGFPRGAYLVFNLSPSLVKLTLEKKPYDFKPGESSLIIDPPVQENQHSAMYAFVKTNEKWQRIGSGLWPNPGTKRSIQVFFDNPESKQTELRGFRDISPPNPRAINAANP